LLIYKGELCYCYITKGVKKEECDKNKNFDKASSKGSSKGFSKREGNKEEQEDCFIDKDFEQEEAREKIILFELTKRVIKYIKK
jgi:hypothetical protein